MRNTMLFGALLGVGLLLSGRLYAETTVYTGAEVSSPEAARNYIIMGAGLGRLGSSEVSYRRRIWDTSGLGVSVAMAGARDYRRGNAYASTLLTYFRQYPMKFGSGLAGWAVSAGPTIAYGMVGRHGDMHSWGVGGTVQGEFFASFPLYRSIVGTPVAWWQKLADTSLYASWGLRATYVRLKGDSRADLDSDADVLSDCPGWDGDRRHHGDWGRHARNWMASGSILKAGLSWEF